MKTAAVVIGGLVAASCGMAMAQTGGAPGTTAQGGGDRMCAQGTYSTPCPRVIWCPTAKCGIGVARADGDLDILYSSEKSMDGTKRRPTQAGQPMDLHSLAGKVIVFEWEESGNVQSPGADLGVKDIHYVIVPPQGGG